MGYEKNERGEFNQFSKYRVGPIGDNTAFRNMGWSYADMPLPERSMLLDRVPGCSEHTVIL